MDLLIAGPEEAKNRGEKDLRRFQIRLATQSLAKISPTCQTNSPQAQIALCNSET